MSEEIVVKAEKLQKIYKLYKGNLEKYMDFFLPKSYGESFYALNDVSFSINKGQSMGLIGLNGSGKSSLANIIAGCSGINSGKLTINGSVLMISISSGIDSQLTGLENIMLKGLLLGLNHKEIKELTPQIIEFADLGDFIYQKVKTYSSGMRSKLGFAISININPDILVIDEALSVGDQTFTSRCLEKMQSFRKNGKTIVFVSHSTPQVKEFCDKVIWLEGGRLKQIGDCKEVTKEYDEFIKKFNSVSEKEKKILYEQIRQKQRSGR